jgi:hypothetical protein
VVVHLHAPLANTDFAEGSEDRGVLVGAGIPKARPFGACNTMAMAGR